MALQRMISSFFRLLSKTWAIAVITIIICAVFVAKAVGSLIAAETLTEAPTQKLPVVPPKPIVAVKTKLDGSKITRNIFCSTCDPIIEGDLGVAEHYTGEPAVLIATMLGEEPRATVRVLASEAQGSWGIGEHIPGVGLVDRIGSTSIDVVDVAGHKGTLSLLEASQVEGRPKKSDSAKSEETAPTDPFADKVKKIADNDFEIDRSLIRDLVTGTTKPGGARAFPITKDGEVQGIRMLGVRPGNVAAALGVKSNDVITTINGEPIKQVQQLLDLYAKLDQLSTVELGGTRGGKPITLTYRLR